MNSRWGRQLGDAGDVRARGQASIMGSAGQRFPFGLPGAPSLMSRMQLAPAFSRLWTAEVILLRHAKGRGNLGWINPYCERAIQAYSAGSDPLADAKAPEALGDAACDILNWLRPKTPLML
jgi:hypothetical protein